MKKINSRMSVRAIVAALVQDNVYFCNVNKMSESSFGLSLVQYHMLATLQHMPGCSPNVLASDLCIHPSTITQTLKRLEKKGAIYIAPDPRDHRKKVVALTLSGYRLVTAADHGVREFLSTMPRNS